MTRWLLCDYGQVLSLPPPPEEWDALRAAAGGGSEEDFRGAYWRHRASYDRSDLSAGEYWELVSALPPDAGRLRRLVEIDTAMWAHPNEPAVEAASRCARRGMRLGVLSNAPVEVAAGIDALAWLAPFERRFYSCQLGAVKPEPEAYTRVLEALRAEPADVWFFDDREDNVEAAAAIGIRAALFSGPCQLDRL